MQLPESRFGFSSRRDRRRHRRRIAVVLLLLIGVATGGFFLSRHTFGADNTAESSGEGESGKQSEKASDSLSSLWERKEYSRINELCEQRLEEEPLAQKYLAYNGFSYFYRGVSQYTLEDQLLLFDKAVVNLRKILVFEQPLLKEKVHYILGKTYYHKGRFYTDQAITHLQRSLDLGYSADDIHRYLGLSYGKLDKYQASVDHFLKATETSADPILFMTIGRTYYKMERMDEAIDYLNRAVDRADSSTIKEKSRFLLGNIFHERGALKKAEEQYKHIISNNDQSADAHYYLGNVYEKRNNRVKARAEWRKALEIDPSHHGALLKLYD